MEGERASSVALSVLGDVTLRAGGAEIPLSPQRMRILAVLAAAAGSTVSRAELLDDLWGEDTEACRHRLKSQIAQLRTLLGSELSIDYHLDGYRLRGSLELLDSTLFESLVTGGRSLGPVDRANRLRQALRLWRAAWPFRGVNSLLVDDACRRLVALRTTTVLELADCEIELRSPQDSIELLTAIFEDDPTRGDVTVRLASLLALANRDVDGVHLIAQHRGALIESGFALASELEELELRILRQEFISPSLSSPRDDRSRDARFQTPAQPIRREALYERVARELRDGPVILCGEAGVGKTVLTLALSEELEKTGRIVVCVSVRAEPTRPMEAMADIVDRFRTRCPGLLKEHMERPALAAAVDRLSGRHSRAGLLLTREVLLSELTALVGGIVLATDGVLIVEDAHWLDHSSAEILGQLIDDHLPGLLITTRHPLPDVFGPAWAVNSMIEMPPFTIAEVRELMELSFPARATDELVEELHQKSGGNGVFLRLELDLLTDGQLGHDVSPTLLEAVNERTRRFSAMTRTVLQTAALLGQSFLLGPLATVHPHVEDALREAVEERLVRLDLASGTGEFVHGLVVEALVDLMPNATRIARHDQLCRALMAQHGSPTAISTHAVGSELLDPVRAVVSCLGAARQQAAVFEWASTIVWARLGVAVGERSGLDAPLIEAELRTLLGTGMRRLGLPGSNDELGRASDLAFASGAHELLVECVTELCLHGPTTKVGKADEVGRRHLERALAAPVEPVRRAALLSAGATLMAVSDDVRLGRSLYRQALDIVEGVNDPVMLRAVRLNAHLGLSHPDDLADRRRAMDGLLALDDHEAHWEGNFLRFGLALIDADRRGLDESCEELRRLTAAVKQRDQQRGLRQVESVHQFIEGNLDRAGELADETLQMALISYPESFAFGIYAALLVPIREVQGRAGELLPQVSALIASAPGYITWHALAAAVAYARDERSVMARELSYLAEHDLRFAEDLTWTAVATMVCRPIWALRDATSAAVLYRRLGAYSDLMTWNGLSTHGPIDAGLACLADVLADDVAVARHVDKARMLVDRLGAHHLHWPELDVLV